MHNAIVTAAWLPPPLRAVCAAAGMAALAAGALAAVLRFRPLRWGPAVAFVAATPVVTAGTLAGVGLLAASEIWWAAITAAAVAIVLVATQAPMFLRGAPAAAPGRRVTVMTSNLLFGEADPRALVAAVRDRAVDVLAVQELTDDAIALLNDAGMCAALPHFMVSPRDDPGGAGLWSRFPLEPIDVPIPFNYPPVVARVDVDGRRVVIASVHPASPWPSDGEAWSYELRSMADWLDGIDEPIVVAGDFNSTVDHRQFREILRRGFVDAASHVGGGFRPTWPVGRRALPVIAIDHVLTRGGPHPVSLTALTIVGTDHRALVVPVQLPL